MIVRFRLGNITEMRPSHGKLDHHVSGGWKRDGFKQLHVSVKFTKYGNTFRPVFTIQLWRQFTAILRYPFASIYRDLMMPSVPLPGPIFGLSRDRAA